MLRYGKQSVSEDDIDAVVAVLQSDWLTQGPVIEKFETALAKRMGAKHACAVANGTAALHLAGLALGWKPGDVVIASTMSFVATANCIVYSGATPVLADIDPQSYTLDPNKLEESINSLRKQGRSVKSVVAVDYAGHPADWEALREIANRYEIFLVNDNCHALGAMFKGDHHYSAQYADVVVQSFHPVKAITTGEGGAVVTNSSSIDGRVRMLRAHGITKDITLMSQNHGPWYYEMVDLGYNYRITDIQCALGLNQLKKLDGFLQRRREIAKQYEEFFEGKYRYSVPVEHENVRHAYHLFPLLINFNETETNRRQFFENMKLGGVELQVHYLPVHLQPFYRNKYGTKVGECPVAEEFYSREVSLPIYPTLNDSELEFVARLIDECLDPGG